MPKVEDIPLVYAMRNVLRRAGVEVLPARVDSSLLAMHLDRLFSTLNVSCVLDVGARVGDYGLWLRRNGYCGDIISFEPVTVNFKELEKAAARDSNWHCFNYALGAEDNISSINVAKHTEFSSFWEMSAAAQVRFGEETSTERSEDVAIRRLDSVLDTLPTKLTDRIYLKLDTQGWDLEVLKGAQAVLKRVTALQTEVSVQPIYDGMPVMQDSLAAIAGYGFIPSGFFPVHLDSRMAAVEFDLVAVRSAPGRDPREN
ncbi:MAG: FkbM family methyltransferase [Trebonia sp.]